MLCWYVEDIFCAFDSKHEMDQFFYNLNKYKFFKKGGSRRAADLYGCPTNKKREWNWNNYLEEKHSYRTVQQMGMIESDII